MKEEALLEASAEDSRPERRAHNRHPNFCARLAVFSIFLFSTSVSGLTFSNYLSLLHHPADYFLDVISFISSLISLFQSIEDLCCIHSRILMKSPEARQIVNISSIFSGALMLRHGFSHKLHFVAGVVQILTSLMKGFFPCFGFGVSCWGCCSTPRVPRNCKCGCCYIEIFVSFFSVWL
eukprot:GHVP01026956.1.p1 GENE.GHVP01026956.1~~GHVP01026956.1.p1  ORF type:complete len:179 (-),score=21.90 GHVP01026956.1:116-652(-)